MTSRLRTGLAALTLATLAVGASACGGTAASAPAASAPGTSAPSASGETSPSVTSTGNAFAPGSSVDAASVKQMLGDATTKATSVHVDMTMSGRVQMSGSGDIDMKARPMKASLHLTSTSLGGDITMLMVDNAMYLRSPMFGAKYVKVATNDKSSPIGQMGLDSLDPSAMFDRLGDAFSGGTYVGQESVDGTPAEHYRFTLDGKALASALPSAAASAAGSIRSGQTMDVWFDSAGRYRKMAMSLSGENVTETFSAWGTPVAVTAPPAAQVQDMSRLMIGGGK